MALPTLPVVKPDVSVIVLLNITTDVPDLATPSQHGANYRSAAELALLISHHLTTVNRAEIANCQNRAATLVPRHPLRDAVREHNIGRVEHDHASEPTITAVVGVLLMVLTVA